MSLAYDGGRKDSTNHLFIQGDKSAQVQDGYPVPSHRKTTEIISVSSQAIFVVLVSHIPCFFHMRLQLIDIEIAVSLLY